MSGSLTKNLPDEIYYAAIGGIVALIVAGIMAATGSSSETISLVVMSIVLLFIAIIVFNLMSRAI